MKRPFPLILAAPSGAGKTTIARALLSARPDVGYSVSATTRAPRAGERDGESYYFLSKEAFRSAVDADEFCEHAEVHGAMYGTLKREVARVLESGRHVVMDIDVQGTRQFVRVFPDTVTVFVLPPDGETLVERLRGRGTETAPALARRLANAREELAAVHEYDYVVVNDDLDLAVARVSAIIDGEASRRTRLTHLEEFVSSVAAVIDEQLSTLTPREGIDARLYA